MAAAVVSSSSSELICEDSNIDPKALESLAKYPRVAVYGYRDCEYLTIIVSLREAGKLVSTYCCADTDKPLPMELSLPGGRTIEQLPLKTGIEDVQMSKTGLNNIVLENAKRILLNETRKEHHPLIPILFCIDIDGNRHKLPNIQSVASKDKATNGLVTSKELRRALKLTLHTDKTISEAAKQTFHFVKVHTSEKIIVEEDEKVRLVTYSFEEIDKPWGDKADDELIKEYESIRGKNPTLAEGRGFKSEWRNQLTEAITKFREKIQS